MKSLYAIAMLAAVAVLAFCVRYFFCSPHPIDFATFVLVFIAGLIGGAVGILAAE